jgi:hypothetical protein
MMLELSMAKWLSLKPDRDGVEGRKKGGDDGIVVLERYHYTLSVSIHRKE